MALTANVATTSGQVAAEQWLIVTGCTTSVCVESTTRDAMFRDCSCRLLADSSSARFLEAVRQEPLARASLAR